ncbi:hypothetical protein TNCV_536431 [Trichonephila clavipes]|nr:hypothetical protein TNCV_536431 [Trichonephila clavipes]
MMLLSGSEGVAEGGSTDDSLDRLFRSLLNLPMGRLCEASAVVKERESRRISSGLEIMRSTRSGKRTCYLINANKFCIGKTMYKRNILNEISLRDSAYLGARTHALDRGCVAGEFKLNYEFETLFL